MLTSPTSGTPPLAITLFGAHAIVSWPLSTVGFGLQQNAQPGTTNGTGVARASTKTVTEQMSAEFDAADAVLTDQMDNLVPQFQSATAVFVTDYNNARIIVVSGGGGGKSKPTPPPTPPNP